MSRYQAICEKLRTRPLRWVLFACLITVPACLVVFDLPLKTAIAIHAYAGYYFCLAVFGFLLYTTYQMLRGVNIKGFAHRRWRGLLIVLLAAIFLHLFKPHMMRVFNDEPAHQMTAKMFHEERINAVPEVGYYLKGDLAYGERSLNYRMYFYPFLVSILHDLTGFRVLNGALLNAFLGFLLFLSVYLGGNRIHSNGGGLVAVLLLAGLPLLDETVTSYGYDVTNLLFLSLFFLGLILYAERKDEIHLNWLIATGLALAYSRNESTLYLLTVGILFAFLFLRHRSCNLTRFACVSPLLLLPIFAARRLFQAVMVNLPEMFPHLESDQFFSLDFIPVNFARVGEWLFDLSTTTISYPILSFVGVAGVIALFSGLIGDIVKRKAWKAVDGIVLLFVATVLGSFVFVTLSLFWNPVAGEAVRFLLPLHLAFAYVAVWLLSRANNADFWMPVFVVVAGLGIFFVGIPSKMRQVGGSNAVFAKYADWSLDWLSENDAANTLFVSQLHTFFLLHGHPAMDLSRASQNVRALVQLEAEGYYSRIVVFVIERYSPESGTWAPPSPALPLSDRIVTDVIAERRWAYNQRARFLEVIGYRDDAGKMIPIEEIRPLKHDFESFRSYWDAMRILHPGLVRGQHSSRLEPEVAH